MEKPLEDALKIVNKKHDLIALAIEDPFEQELPNIGLVQFKDAETGEMGWFNSNSSKNRTKWKANALKRDKELRSLLLKCGVDFTKIQTDKPYIKPLMNLFKQR